MAANVLKFTSCYTVHVYLLVTSFSELHANALVLIIKNVFLFNCSDELLNAMGSARLEIMDERDEEKENKTVTQQKVLP